MINDEEDEVIKYLFDSLKNRYQHNLEQRKTVNLYSITFIYCIINCIKKIRVMVDHI